MKTNLLRYVCGFIISFFLLLLLMWTGGGLQHVLTDWWGRAMLIDPVLLSAELLILVDNCVFLNCFLSTIYTGPQRTQKCSCKTVQENVQHEQCNLLILSTHKLNSFLLLDLMFIGDDESHFLVNYWILQVNLHFTENALRLIAKKAMAKNTGARGLRAILENILTEAMFQVYYGVQLDCHDMNAGFSFFRSSLSAVIAITLSSLIANYPKS